MNSKITAAGKGAGEPAASAACARFCAMRVLPSPEPPLSRTFSPRSTNSSSTRQSDERAIDLLGVGPVEAIERLERAEAGEPRATREIDGDARSLLEIGEVLERLGRAEATGVNVREE